MTHTFTREELYTLVWSEPIQKIAPRYGLSDRGFGKLCARYDPSSAARLVGQEGSREAVRPEPLAAARAERRTVFIERHRKPARYVANNEAGSR
jgi:hypothetical protein